MKVYVLLYVMIGLLLAVSVSADFDTGLVAHYTFDVACTTDDHASYDLSATGTPTVNSTAKVGANSCNFNLNGNEFLKQETVNENFGSNTPLTMNIWYYRTGESNGGSGAMGYGVNDEGGRNIEANHETFWRYWANPTNQNEGALRGSGTNTWQMQTFVYNGSHTEFYVNGTLMYSVISGSVDNDERKLFIGTSQSATTSWQGNLDEASIWNVSLNTTQLACLFNGSSGLVYSSVNWTNECVAVPPPVGSAPNITLDNVTSPTGLVYGDGSVIEFEVGSWTINYTVQGGNITSTSLNMTNSSGSVIFSNNTVGGTTSHFSSSLVLNFTENNPYTVNLTVVNGDKQNSTVITFNFTDTADPVCYFGSSYMGNVENNLSLVVNCSDTNFYSVNITCPVTGNSFFVNGLNVESYTINEVFTNITDDDTCSFRYCDGHTKNSLEKSWDVITSESKADVLVNSVSVASVYTYTPGGVVSYDIKEDRVSYTFDLSSSVADEFVFYLNISEGKGVYLKDDKYHGWVVINDMYWFDMNSVQLDENDKVKVKKLSDSLFEISVKVKDKVITFESIGELNCVTGSFGVVSRPQFRLKLLECDNSTEAKSILLVGFLVVIVLLFMFQYHVKSAFYSLVMSGVLFYWSWSVALCWQFALHMFIALGFLSLANCLFFWANASRKRFN